MSKGTGKVSIGAGRDHPGKKLKVWLAQNALVLSVGLLLSMALYYPIVRDGLENLDSFCTAEPYWADQWEQIPYWETVQGRWGLRLCDALTAGMHPYFLTVLAVSVFYLLGTLLICDLLDIQSRYLRLVSAALVGCSQYVMNIQTYRYCSAAYAFSFFLAVLAAVLASRRRGSLVAAGALCLLFSLGLYQCSLGVTAVLCLFVIFRVLVRRGRFDTEVRTAVTRLVAMGGAGTLGYLIVLQVFLKLYGVSLASINGIDQVGMGLLPRIPEGIRQAYQDFWEYFFGREIAQNYYSIRVLHVLLFLCAGMAVIALLFGRRKNPAVCIGLLLCLALLPAAANVTDIINPSTRIVLRMAGGMAVVPVFCVGLLAQSAWIPAEPLKKYSVLLLGVVLLRGYMLQSNNDIQVLQSDKNQGITLGYQILAQLDDREEYGQGMQVAIIGYPEVASSEYRNKANPLIRNGIFPGYAENNRDAWIRLMDQELGAQISWCSYSQQAKIWASEAFAAMPTFPREGSIAVLDDVLVVKIS